MRFDCGPTWEEKKQRFENWHPFFAVLPRLVGPRECRAFEWIERKGVYHEDWVDARWTWEYRAMVTT